MVLVTSIMVTALLDLTAALLCGVVAQQVRASDCRSEGCEFEPRQLRQTNYIFDWLILTPSFTAPVPSFCA